MSISVVLHYADIVEYMFTKSHDNFLFVAFLFLLVLFIFFLF